MKRIVPGLLVLIVLAALTGCVAIPRSSSPQPVEEFARNAPTNLVPVPRRSDDPETLVRGFVKAMADPESTHQAARRFLTPAALQNWDDEGPMTVLDEVRVVVDERNETAVRLRVIGNRIGTLSSAGQLTPGTGEQVIPLTLTQVNGAWRIEGAVPPGSFTDRAQFEAAYRQVALYFPDRTATRLVADQRWLFGAGIDPTVLINRLLAGPAPDLTGAVAPAVGKDVQLRGAVEHADEEVTVNLGGLVDADSRSRTVLAAQLIWTLDEAGIRGTYLISADGGPLIAERADGWRTADVKAFDPEPDLGPVPLHVVAEGALRRITEGGTAPVGGSLGVATDLRSAAISVNQEVAAAVAVRDGRARLLAGPYGGEVSEVAAGGDIATPSFGAAVDLGYALIDGRPVQWSRNAETGEARVVPLDVSQVAAVDAQPITSFKISPDGVRAALVVGERVLLGAVSTSDRGVPSLTGVHPVSYGVGTPVVSIAWGGVSTVYLAREGTDSPIMRIPLSGLPATALVSGNLKPPVRVVAATRTTVYAGDSRTVLELGTAAGAADQYWTSIDGVGAGAIPVTQSG